jgi:hypothetical protein
MSSTALYWLIIGCEVSFWVVLFAGLAARYLLKRITLSKALLLALPVVDLILLAVTALDLRSGTTATFAHGLAAAYVGFTVAFGGIAVAWADARFAHRFMKGPAPPRPPKAGWPGLRYELLLWARCLVAVAITWALLAALIALVDDADATKALQSWFGISIGCAFFWFVFGPLWQLVFDSWRREGA